MKKIEYKNIILFFYLIFNSLLVFSQTDTLVVSSQKDRGRFLGDAEPSPKKAALLSLAVPGLGQVYNRKLWKVPIVYAGLGTTVYLINRNGKIHRRFKIAYRQRLAGEPDEFEGILDDNGIKTLRDGARKSLEQSWFAFGIVYLLNSVDAFVDAHLYEFNVSDDLTLGVKPNFQNIELGKSTGEPTAGISFILKF